ncbi:hypothetical protein [uncultured Thiohalocapsa sp.]|uniref:hypothetical protein n=1 Tax=uncultured Thiohalocapsa sp. TaxID=768990 RepID=UPI0025F852D4|nr:hypothetical protein [uncultured Thiohalocapsa sp.]
MSPDTLLTAYAEIAQRHGLPHLEPATLALTPTPCADPDAAWQALVADRPHAGWLQFQSQVLCFDNGELPASAPDWGGLLAAEAVTTDRRSLLLRQTGNGLLLVTATPNPADASSEALLAEDLQRLATARAPGALCYRRYWRREPELGLRPYFAAFTGFAPADRTPNLQDQQDR